MSNILSIEQMKHLLELGLKIDKASCSYSRHIPTDRTEVVWGYEEDTNDVLFETIPAFTLQDILDLLPPYLYEDFGLCLYLMIEQLNDDGTKEWSIRYCSSDYSDFDVEFTSENIIECAYDMLCHCIANNYI